MEQPVKFGADYSMPTATQARKSKLRREQSHGKKLVTKEEVHRLLEESQDTFLLI